jgi:hypothetical protein
VVIGSPFKVSFSSGAVAPERATVEGSGVAGGLVSSSIELFVQLRDQFSNPVRAPANVVLVATAPDKTNYSAFISLTDGKEKKERVIFFVLDKTADKFLVATRLFGTRQRLAGILILST